MWGHTFTEEEQKRCTNWHLKVGLKGTHEQSEHKCGIYSKRSQSPWHRNVAIFLWLQVWFKMKARQLAKVKTENLVIGFSSIIYSWLFNCHNLYRLQWLLNVTFDIVLKLVAGPTLSCSLRKLQSLDYTLHSSANKCFSTSAFGPEVSLT